MKTKDTQLTESDMQWGKGLHECISFRIFGAHKNKLAYNNAKLE